MRLLTSHVLAGVLFFVAVTSHADTVFDQSPPGTDGRVSDFTAGFVDQQAQSFTLAADTSIETIEAFGFYSSGLPDDYFTVRIFLDNGGGSPAINPTTDLTLLAVRVATGGNALSGANIYRYTFSLAAPLALTAGTPYYLSIVNNTNNAERWNWSTFGGTGGDLLRWNRASDVSAWSSGTTNLAFLLADGVTPPVSGPAPEPRVVPTLPLFGLMLMSVGVFVVGALGLRRR
ncbi:MAG: hypothetical protein V7746_15245 [Halioglobus sp.]